MVPLTSVHQILSSLSSFLFLTPLWASTELVGQSRLRGKEGREGGGDGGEEHWCALPHKNFTQEEGECLEWCGRGVVGGNDEG